MLAKKNYEYSVNIMARYDHKKKWIGTTIRSKKMVRYDFWWNKKNGSVRPFQEEQWLGTTIAKRRMARNDHCKNEGWFGTTMIKKQRWIGTTIGKTEMVRFVRARGSKRMVRYDH